MRVLIIENRGLLISALDSLIRDTYSFVREIHGNDVIDVAYTINEAVARTKDNHYDLIFFDPYVEQRGMEYLHRITPDRMNYSSDKAHLKAISLMPPVIVFGNDVDNVPKECVFVKKVIRMPFESEKLKSELLDMVEESFVDEVLLLRNVAIDPRAELKKSELAMGTSYFFLSESNGGPHAAARLFAQAGYEVIVISLSAPKIIRETLGLDQESEVYQLKGDRFLLGSAVKFVRDKLATTKDLVIYVDNFEGIVVSEGLGRAMVFLNEVVSSESENRFTVLSSLNRELVTENVIDIIERKMELK